MIDYVYYPGCSVKSSAKHYEESILPVFRELGVNLKEIEDWNCCGATATPSVDKSKTSALNGRILALAEKEGEVLLAPCAACYLSLKKSHLFLTGGSKDAQKILDALKKQGLEYKGGIQVKHPLEILTREIGLKKIKDRVMRRLTGLRVASYYGCQIVRPYADFDDPENPIIMDDVMAALGAEPVDYSAKTRCCGGALTANIDAVGIELNYLLLKEAKRKQTDVFVTLCPLCLFNLEISQNKVIKEYKQDLHTPVLFFSQLMGLAFGLSKESMGFQRSLIPLDAMWKKIESGENNE